MADEAEQAAEAIRELCRRRVERIRDKEFDAMVDEFYATDAILLPTRRPAVQGIEAIRAFWRETPETGMVSLSLEPTYLEAGDGLAYEVGNFDRTLRPRHGAPFQDRGKYLVVYRRVGGRWRAVAEMFNNDR